MCKDISDQDVDLAYHLQQSAYVSPYQATSPPGQTHLTRWLVLTEYSEGLRL